MTTELEQRVHPELYRRVEVGFDFFEHDYPHILKSVDLQILDMSNPCKCLLGQPYGHFDDGLDELDLTLGDAVMYGLDVWMDEPYENNQLTPIWKAKIEAWRNANL